MKEESKMLSANFVMPDGSTVAISAKLAEYLLTVFQSASASSAVANRGERAELLVKYFDKLESAMTQEVTVKNEETDEDKTVVLTAESIVLDTIDETIEVKTHNLLARLANIPSAIACNEEYKQNVKHTPKVTSESTGKRGKKKIDLEAVLTSAFS
jgi:hypothetical protein